MKKLQIFALAAIMAIGLGSCVKESGDPQAKDTARLIIRLAGVKSNDTRAIEEGAVEDALDINGANSRIFVADPAGNIVAAVAINKAEAVDGAGQVIDQPFAIGSSVYIVANIPTDDVTAVAANTTLAGVKADVAEITTQSGYEFPAMANVNGAQVTFNATNVTGDMATVNVSIAPLIARLELVAMQARETATAEDFGNVITGFTVGGIYIGEYFEGFTYTGAADPDGEVVSLEAAISEEEAVLADVLSGWAWKDLDTVDAEGEPLIASEPEEGEVWAYNVVAAGLPNMVIRLDNIVYTNAGGETDQALGTRYLTVVGYRGEDLSEVAEFVRGQVYRVGQIEDGESNFVFGYGDLSVVPYEDSYKLTVQVEVIDWEINDYIPIFD